MNNLDAWIIRQKGAKRNARLYCFSHAGGSAASYLEWQGKVDPQLEICGIQLPGRGTRWTEPFCESWRSLVYSIATAITSESAVPFSFFGHSLGAAIAFEVARYLQQAGHASPDHLFVSGANAPQYFGEGHHLHESSDEQLIDTLREYGGTLPEFLEHRELMSLTLPVVRADFTLVSQYAYRKGPRLACPITVLAGKDDDHTSAARIRGWDDESDAPVEFRWFSGGHFFLNEHLDAVVDCISSSLVGAPVSRCAG